jgi:hypothetical protein
MNDYYFGTISMDEEIRFVIEVEVCNFIKSSQVGWVRIAEFDNAYKAMSFFSGLTVKARMITENVETVF